jgi:hypothetical protein
MSRRHPLFLSCHVIISGLFFTACDDTNEGATDFTPDSVTDESGDTNSGANTDADSDTGIETDAIETPYQGFEDLYILTSSDDPVDVCRVRYELHAVDEPEVPCEICEWDVVVEKSHPKVVLDLGGACANSDLVLDEAAIEAPVGERVAYGFASEYVGHASILMRYNEASGRWEGFTPANWNPETSVLRYNNRDGICTYAGQGDTEPSTVGICGFSGEATVSNLEI